MIQSKTERQKALHNLTNGEIEIVAQFAWSSNYTFLTQVTCDQETLAAVYKPSQGERPLWDFPPESLAAREVAAFITSNALGWDLVPPTVLRQDGPAGSGSLQLFIDADPERHYFTFSAAEKQRLRPVVAFDIIINNADRKGGHVLLTQDDRIHLIDHGVCFHHEYKLRTVVWDFVDEAIPQEILAQIATFLERLETDDDLTAAYLALLREEEIQAMKARTKKLLAERCFPKPGPGRSYPYPLV